MREISFILLMLTCFHAHCQICDGMKVIVTEDAECVQGGWELVFDDEFDSTGIDTRKWAYALPWGNHLATGFRGSLEYVTNGENIIVRDGVASLLLKSETIERSGISYIDSAYIFDDGIPNYRKWPYTAGMLFSHEKFGYGRYELRCKIPKGKGVLSAFWLFGQNGADRNEIDVFEFWNEKNVIGELNESKLSTTHHMTIHYKDRMCETNYDGPDYSIDFHTFVVVWDPYKIEWFVDGVLKRVSTKFHTLSGQQVDCHSVKQLQEYILNNNYPMDPEMHVIISTGIQSGLESPDDKVKFPVSLDVDYFRYYRRIK